MARPKKQPEAKRDLRVNFRLSSSDATALAERAKAAGLSVSAYAREQALVGKVQVVETMQLDFTLLRELNRIGVNLNQLAREQHRRGHHDPAYLEELCSRIEALIDRAVDSEPRP